MTNFNNDFMESYKCLDKICKEIFNSENGVTTYIDTMKETNDGNRYVPLWNETLYKLKHYRYIRNRYAHEVGTSQYDICTKDDIEWLNNFYKEIMQTTDPLAQYRRKKNSYRTVKTSKCNGQMDREEEKKIPYQKVNFQRDDEEDAGCLNIILKFLIIMGINLLVVLVIIFIII